jgi:hypothetical protein
MSTEVWVWCLTGVMSLVTVLSATIWKMLRDESKKQAEAIEKKADQERLHEVEGRWREELNTVRENHKELLVNQDRRHERDLDQMSIRLGDQIRNSESNILAQIKLMIEVLKPSNKFNQ